MSQPIPAEVFVAVATVVAALIAGLVAYVSLTLTKEQKTSEFRQSWIDGLRSDLAEFFAAARACTRAFEEMGAYGEKYKSHPFTMDAEKISQLRHSVAQTFYKIKLRLNPDEADHAELLRLLWRVAEEQNKQLTSAVMDTASVLKAIDIASDFSRPVLKTEWKRVKDGEPQYRATRNFAIPAVLVLSLLFAVALMVARIEAT